MTFDPDIQNVNMFCAWVADPPDADGFDFEYFRTRHAPMFAKLLGNNCVRFEVHRGLVAPGAPPPPFVAAAYFWVISAEDFGQRSHSMAPQSMPISSTSAGRSLWADRHRALGHPRVPFATMSATKNKVDGWGIGSCIGWRLKK